MPLLVDAWMLVKPPTPFGVTRAEPSASGCGCTTAVLWTRESLPIQPVTSVSKPELEFTPEPGATAFMTSPSIFSRNGYDSGSSVQGCPIGLPSTLEAATV